MISFFLQNKTARRFSSLLPQILFHIFQMDLCFDPSLSQQSHSLAYVWSIHWFHVVSVNLSFPSLFESWRKRERERSMGVVSRTVFPVCESLCCFCPALRARSRHPVKRYKHLLADIFPRSQVLFCLLFPSIYHFTFPCNITKTCLVLVSYWQNMSFIGIVGNFQLGMRLVSLLHIAKSEP